MHTKNRKIVLNFFLQKNALLIQENCAKIAFVVNILQIHKFVKNCLCNFAIFWWG